MTTQPKPYMTGMLGVYLTAAELTKRNLIVSPTPRSAFGADLPATDANCNRVWSVQVKTNLGRPTFWLLNKHSKKTRADTHIYVLVNLGERNKRQKQRGKPDYYIVPSRLVAERMRATPPNKRKNSVFYSIFLNKVSEYQDNWGIFK